MKYLMGIIISLSFSIANASELATSNNHSIAHESYSWTSNNLCYNDGELVPFYEAWEKCPGINNYEVALNSYRNYKERIRSNCESNPAINPKCRNIEEFVMGEKDHSYEGMWFSDLKVCLRTNGKGLGRNSETIPLEEVRTKCPPPRGITMEDIREAYKPAAKENIGNFCRRDEECGKGLSCIDAREGKVGRCYMPGQIGDNHQPRDLRQRMRNSE